MSTHYTFSSIERLPAGVLGRGCGIYVADARASVDRWLVGVVGHVVRAGGLREDDQSAQVEVTIADLRSLRDMIDTLISRHQEEANRC